MTNPGVDLLSTDLARRAVASPAVRVTVACLLLGLSGRFSPSLTPWIFLAVLGAALWTQSLRAGQEDPFLRTFTLFAFGVRVAAMLALFYVSLFKLPLLEAYQLDGGFWAFAPDAKGYHEMAEETVGRLRLGLPPPQAYGLGEGPYFYLLIALYWVLGVNPMNGLLVNCWAGAATVPLAYVLGSRLGGPRAGRLSAVLIGLWPSAALWSTQLLKDPLVVYLLLALCVALVNALHERGREVSRHRVGGFALTAARLVVLSACLRLFNLYVPLGLIGAAALTMLPVAVLGLRTKEGWRRGGILVGMWLMLVVGLSVSQAITLRDMIVAPHSEIQFLRFGDRYLASGRFEEAIGEYRKALIINPLFKPAWFNLSIAHRLAGDTEKAHEQLKTFFNIGFKYQPRVDPIALREKDAPQTFPEPMFRLVSSGAEPPGGAASLPVVKAVETPAGLHLATLADQTDPNSAIVLSAFPGLAAPPASTAPVSVAELVPELTELVPATGEAQRPDTGDGQESADRDTPATHQGGNGRPPVEDQAGASPVRPSMDPPRAEAAATYPSSLYGRFEAAVLARLNVIRQGFVDEGGASTEMDVPTFATLGALVAYIRRALQNVFLFPLPWELSNGDFEAERLLAAAESAVTLALLPMFIVGVWQIVRQRRPGGYLLLFLGFGLALLLGLAIPNLGTLFRKKIFALLPLLVVAMSAHPPAGLRRIRWIARGDSL